MNINNLMDYFSSESGLSNRQKGLSFAWITAVLGGAAMVVGTPEDAQATYVCCDPCAWAGGQAVHWEKKAYTCGNPVTEGCLCL